ncbi:unnamed protein product [Dibothriocephalus latus]|uniref:Uncharacterized protein n=1 Tax=Dibothriocephalus latus TaxID=60516 RepID=A0A3P6U367_DIBLA|nr:unnamed protein product [Dibothriocephalus latus]
MLCSSKQRPDRNLPCRINRYPLELSRLNEPPFSGDRDARMKNADRRKLHKALRHAKLPHCLLEFWRCSKDQHWNHPESILDAHMERNAYFKNDVTSHHRLSNFGDGKLEDEEEDEDCRGFILLEETEMTMENHSLPQDLPSRECSSDIILNISGKLEVPIITTFLHRILALVSS